MTDEKWRTAWELFCQAKNLRGEERPKFLATATADAELELEVHALLEVSLSCAIAEDSTTEVASQPVRIYAAGEDVDHYTIVGRIGRGASGEVYAARDRELGRTVALKFLAQTHSGDLSGFIQEARTVSALNHPNIVTVYEFIQIPGQLAIVMEFIEGASLRSFCGLPAPLREVARYGNQIAQALAAAHKAGIVHRDVKPENIIVRPDGYVKLLDFGLARNFQDGGHTRFAGTLRYMSPEQVRGEPTTSGADVFSLGLILYELSTGVHPFPAENPLAAAEAIAERVPVTPSRRHPGLPRQWDHLILAMLSKDPASRPAAGQVARSLEEIASVKPYKKMAVAGLVAALLAAVLLLAQWWFRREPEIQLTTRPLSGQGGHEGIPALSPDGRHVVYSWKASQSDPVRILLQEVGSDRVTRLPINHKENIGSLTWTPDGKHIGFYTRSHDSASFRIINTDGTHEEKVLELSPSTAHDFSWSPDGRLLAFTDFDGSSDTSRIFLYSFEKRQRIQLTRPPARYNSDLNPAFSPDGAKIAFRRVLTMSDSDIWLADVRNPSQVRRLTSNHTRGQAIVWTMDGRAVIASTGIGAESGLWFYPVNAPTSRRRLTEFGMQAWNVTSALHEKRLAWVNALDDTNIWRVPISGGSPVRVVASAVIDNDVNCSPSGLLAFRSERSGESEVWMSDAEGNSPARVTNLSGFSGSPRWSPDGRRIVFDSRLRNGNPQIFVVDCEPERMQCGVPMQLTHESMPNALPNWSADGRDIYFASQRTNNWQIWKVSATGGTPIQVTTKGGYFAYESPDGQTLYYSRLGKPGIQGVWRKSLNGAPSADDEGTMVLPLVYAATATWVLSGNEIFYETLLSDVRPSAIWAFDLTTGQKRIIHAASDKPFARGLSVSPDRRFVYFVQTDRSESNVIVADYKYSQ